MNEYRINVYRSEGAVFNFKTLLLLLGCGGFAHDTHT